MPKDSAAIAAHAAADVSKPVTLSFVVQDDATSEQTRNDLRRVLLLTSDARQLVKRGNQGTISQKNFDKDRDRVLAALDQTKAQSPGNDSGQSNDQPELWDEFDPSSLTTGPMSYITTKLANSEIKSFSFHTKLLRRCSKRFAREPLKHTSFIIETLDFPVTVIEKLISYMYGAELPHTKCSLDDDDIKELGKVSLLATHLEMPFIEFSHNSRLCRLMDSGYIATRGTMVYHSVLRGPNDRTQHMLIDSLCFNLMKYPTLEKTFRKSSALDPAEYAPGMWLAEFKEFTFSQLSTDVLRASQQLAGFESIWGKEKLSTKSHLSKIIETMRAAENVGGLDVSSAYNFFSGDWNDDIDVYQHLVDRGYLSTCSELPLSRPRRPAPKEDNDLKKEKGPVATSKQALASKRPPLAPIRDAAVNSHPKRALPGKRKVVADDQGEARKALKIQLLAVPKQDLTSKVTEWLTDTPPSARAEVLAQEAVDESDSSLSESDPYDVPAVRREPPTVVLECAGRELLTWPREDVTLASLRAARILSGRPHIRRLRYNQVTKEIMVWLLKLAKDNNVIGWYTLKKEKKLLITAAAEFMESKKVEVEMLDHLRLLYKREPLTVAVAKFVFKNTTDQDSRLRKFAVEGLHWVLTTNHRHVDVSWHYLESNLCMDLEAEHRRDLADAMSDTQNKLGGYMDVRKHPSRGQFNEVGDDQGNTRWYEKYEGTLK